MGKATEADYGASLLDWLEPQGFDAYPEVQGIPGCGRVDIVAVRSGILCAFEVKLSASLALLAQGEQNATSRYFHYSVVATPRERTGSPIFQKLCAHLGIGWCTI